VDYPTLANEYLALPPSERLSFLTSSVDPLSFNEVKASSEPRDIDSIEWFASPMDICRAFGGLQDLSAKRGLSLLAAILSLNCGGLGPGPSKWTTVWFKGGSEPGVLTLGYLAKGRDGQTYVVTAMLSNPDAALSANALFRTLCCRQKGRSGWSHRVTDDERWMRLWALTRPLSVSSCPRLCPF
jgi:hypothetical protein